ncbi:histone methylation protein DOT1-domain-containing protein [Mycena vitilis]|nr:histone methylation protein DOT1-domain-containing protein [Mycena vitilis]
MAVEAKNGLSFLETFADICSTLRYLKTRPTGNSLIQTANSWGSTGIPMAVLFRIVEESYQRSVGPSIEALKHGTGALVYGELTKSVLYRIFQDTQLTHGCLFLDLGSGVGAAVIQASLQTGCTSYGIEISDIPAKVATQLLAEFQLRCRMWGVRPGSVELEHADIGMSPRLKHLLPQADVLLINNRVFTKTLNATIAAMLISGLKDGARVVTLDPLGVAIHAERGAHNTRNATPFCITTHICPKGSFSWVGEQGHYYLHRITRSSRSEYADIVSRRNLVI